MEVIERPGYLTPWPAINRLLPADERFNVQRMSWKGVLFAPKTTSRLSALLYLLQELEVNFVVQSKGNSSICLSGHTQAILSVRAFQQVRINEDQILEVEVGCDLKNLQTALLENNYELGLEDWIWGASKRSIGSAILEGCHAGLILKQRHISKRLLGVELAQIDGSILKWGRHLQAASVMPTRAENLWGAKTISGVILKAFFQIDPFPPIRWTLAWSFLNRQAMWEHILMLKQAICSWERLDCVIPGNQNEKAFVLAQISGVAEEMEAFKQICPHFELAALNNMMEHIRAFLMQKHLSFISVSLQELKSKLLPSEYLWYHVLMDQCWLVTSQWDSIHDKRR